MQESHTPPQGIVQHNDVNSIALLICTSYFCHLNFPIPTICYQSFFLDLLCFVEQGG